MIRSSEMAAEANCLYCILEANHLTHGDNNALMAVITDKDVKDEVQKLSRHKSSGAVRLLTIFTRTGRSF